MKWLMLLCLTASLSACAALTDIAGTDTSRSTDERDERLGHMIPCLLFNSIHWSKSDTDQTIIEIKRHNRLLEHYCVSK